MSVCPALIESTPKASEVRRASILVTVPKSKASIQYYKKRVSFADILVRKEFDAGSQDGLHEDNELEGVEEVHADEEHEGCGKGNEDDMFHDDHEHGSKCSNESTNHSIHHQTSTPLDGSAYAAEALLFVS